MSEDSFFSELWLCLGYAGMIMEAWIEHTLGIDFWKWLKHTIT